LVSSTRPIFGNATAQPTVPVEFDGAASTMAASFAVILGAGLLALFQL
jgi:hypothetical protein